MKNFAQAEEFKKRLFGSRNAMANLQLNQGGERGEQAVSQVNTISDIETNQGGERQEQYVWNEPGKGETRAICLPSQYCHWQSREEGREEQVVNQANAFNYVETTKNGGDRSKMSANPVLSTTWKHTREGRDRSRLSAKPVLSMGWKYTREGRDRSKMPA